MVFSVTILGSNSAAPASNRFPSSQLVNVQDELFLVDCGEGTQMQLRKYKLRFQKINNIFISHLHGDHYLGLMGFLFSLHLLNREKALHVYATKELKFVIDLQLEVSNCRLVYPLIFHEINHKKREIIFEDEKLTVENIQLKHSVPTSGFLFREKPRLRNINMDVLINEKLEHNDFEKIKRGEDYINPDGKIYKNKDITTEPPLPRSYAYCSDTKYDESIVENIKATELLYCEATFKKELSSIALEKQHCTTVDAANMALEGKVKKLIIGHFSARYDDEDLESLAEEARAIFPNTELAREGTVFNLKM